jgi:hypothetical protein
MLHRAILVSGRAEEAASRFRRVRVPVMSPQQRQSSQLCEECVERVPLMGPKSLYALDPIIHHSGVEPRQRYTLIAQGNDDADDGIGKDIEHGF